MSDRFPSRKEIARARRRRQLEEEIAVAAEDFQKLYDQGLPPYVVHDGKGFTVAPMESDQGRLLGTLTSVPPMYLDMIEYYQDMAKTERGQQILKRAYILYDQLAELREEHEYD